MKNKGMMNAHDPNNLEEEGNENQQPLYGEDMLLKLLELNNVPGIETSDTVEKEKLEDRHDTEPSLSENERIMAILNGALLNGRSTAVPSSSSTNSMELSKPISNDMVTFPVGQDKKSSFKLDQLLEKKMNSSTTNSHLYSQSSSNSVPSPMVHKRVRIRDVPAVKYIHPENRGTPSKRKTIDEEDIDETDEFDFSISALAAPKPKKKRLSKKPPAQDVAPLYTKYPLIQSILSPLGISIEAVNMLFQKIPTLNKRQAQVMAQFFLLLKEHDLSVPDNRRLFMEALHTQPGFDTKVFYQIFNSMSNEEFLTHLCNIVPDFASVMSSPAVVKLLENFASQHPKIRTDMNAIKGNPVSMMQPSTSKAIRYNSNPPSSIPQQNQQRLPLDEHNRVSLNGPSGKSCELEFNISQASAPDGSKIDMSRSALNMQKVSAPHDHQTSSERHYRSTSINSAGEQVNPLKQNIKVPIKFESPSTSKSHSSVPNTGKPIQRLSESGYIPMLVERGPPPKVPINGSSLIQKINLRTSTMQPGIIVPQSGKNMQIDLLALCNQALLGKHRIQISTGREEVNNQQQTINISKEQPYTSASTSSTTVESRSLSNIQNASVLRNNQPSTNTYPSPGSTSFVSMPRNDQPIPREKIDLFLNTLRSFAEALASRVLDKFLALVNNNIRDCATKTITIPFDMSDVSLAFFVDNAVRDSSETIGERVSMRLHDFLIIFRAETRHLSRYDRFQNELKKAIENEENKKKRLSYEKMHIAFGRCLNYVIRHSTLKNPNLNSIQSS
ncbi:hypothetical protein CRE_18741 [Caenorhabditis remanei]|uniref:Uncharacterized protein n=1 Tax=Caenorhabditis remanei TaxID=31234 RepID=E3LJR0_CAERE|nr:hypothetical protein CRE_18741 [Caenorhabditis remanei]